ncbi:hypothetical protein LPJ59_003347 [Coemansia sp. RSA 2399]|nr:hypothetical protein LPJ59_003347 [Coemansia sp. RSA 2399]
MCPDIISEAEKLFGISGCGMSYAAQEGEADEAFTSCDYLELQKQQNEDWAKSIAQSVPDSIKDGDWREVLDKLGHALSLDPKCATALGRRAQIYIRTGRISHAQADIKSLERLEVNVEHLQRQVDEYIRGKRRSERHHDSSPSRRSEKRESSTPKSQI